MIYVNFTCDLRILRSFLHFYGVLTCFSHKLQEEVDEAKDTKMPDVKVRLVLHFVVFVCAFQLFHEVHVRNILILCYY